MGCKAVTPHLVSLAKRLEGKPFHLLATHCQRQPKDTVVSYIKSQGLPADTPNMTISSFGGHPGVKGNGYVPYYMVFDHTGKLAHHHMCGAYHGGDGLKMIEWVDQLLEAAPAIYLGEATWTHIPKLAAQVAKKKSLVAAVKKIEAALASAETPAEAKAEHERLYAALTDYRKRMLAKAETLEAKQPKAVLDTLKDLSKELKGTKLGAPVDTALAAATKSKPLKLAVDLEKKLAKIVRALEAKQEKDKLTDKSRAKSIEKMEKLLAGDNAKLPFAATIKKTIAAWKK